MSPNPYFLESLWPTANASHSYLPKGPIELSSSIVTFRIWSVTNNLRPFSTNKPHDNNDNENDKGKVIMIRNQSYCCHFDYIGTVAIKSLKVSQSGKLSFTSTVFSELPLPSTQIKSKNWLSLHVFVIILKCCQFEIQLRRAFLILDRTIFKPKLN